MGKGQELYKYAKTMIPGGTQLLSKRPEQFLPDQWPAYYSSAKGCAVVDLDGNEYVDASYMGIGACILGYAFDKVDSAVKTAIDKGSLCTLNAPEEVFLAEKLLSLHRWADMIRYAKTGGEAVAIAVRIARAATRKDKVLFCGYHGWHDWYLSANIAKEDSLSGHLLAGLDPAGVPRGLIGTSLPFHYNDINAFKKLCEEHSGEIAAVVMEPIRDKAPDAGFMEEIRGYTEKNGVALVFDEVTAGFRLTCGGSHLTLPVCPDIAVFGKALGNGYPIAAVLGREKFMSAAQDTFISSLFWTERTGFAAALATIDYHMKHNVDARLVEIGEDVKSGWSRLGKKHGLPVDTGGISPLAHFSFSGWDNQLELKTLFIQEMLKRGYLASTAFYTSWAHTPGVIDKYLAAVDEVFGIIAKTDDVAAALEGPVCHSGFARLT